MRSRHRLQSDSTGGACEYPDKVSCADFSMNSDYREAGELKSACDFNGTGVLIEADPSKSGVGLGIHHTNGTGRV